ncbi:MAG: hypothetical protein U0271_25465 [Polyangiaceae bacterium]
MRFIEGSGLFLSVISVTVALTYWWAHRTMQKTLAALRAAGLTPVEGSWRVRFSGFTGVARSAAFPFRFDVTLGRAQYGKLTIDLPRRSGVWSHLGVGPLTFSQGHLANGLVLRRGEIGALQNRFVISPGLVARINQHPAWFRLGIALNAEQVLVGGVPSALTEATCLREAVEVASELGQSLVS